MVANKSRTELKKAISNMSKEIRGKACEPGALIPILQMTQEKLGYIPKDAIEMISRETKIPESEIFGVITFYKQFRMKPLGKFLVRLCDGTACHVNNAKMLIDVIKEELKLENDDTSSDGLFTLTPVACLGCCSLAPVIMVNDETYGRLSPQKLRKIIKEYRAKEQTGQERSN